ncbi:hypothetical protein MRX96_028716 [Rhipicephalus microplus]
MTRRSKTTETRSSGILGEDVFFILSKGLKTHIKAHFSIGFTFEHRYRPRSGRQLHSKTSRNTICVFRHSDSSEQGTKQAGIDEVLGAFEALENGVQRTTASDDASYIVPAPVSSTCAYQNYFVYKFSGVSMPDFFISLGHQLRGDPLRSSCVVKPLTSSRNPQS